MLVFYSSDHFSTESICIWANIEVTTNRTGVKFLTVLIAENYMQSFNCRVCPNPRQDSMHLLIYLLVVPALTSAEATNIKTKCSERKHWSHNRAGGRCTCRWWGDRLLKFNHWKFYMKIVLWNQNTRFLPKQGLRKLRPSREKSRKKSTFKRDKEENRYKWIM